MVYELLRCCEFEKSKSRMVWFDLQAWNTQVCVNSGLSLDWDQFKGLLTF